MYKISIIIPIYNTEKELVNTIESIINQTMNFNDIEVILVNDGSTDKSPEVMEHYSKKYGNIKSIHLDKNYGSPGKPRNVGMEHATAPYVMFQDSDDTYAKNACEYLYNVIENDDVDIAGGMLTIKNKQDEDIIPYPKWASILDTTDDKKSVKEKRIFELLSKEELYKYKINSIEDNINMLNDSGFTSKIYKKSFLEKNNIEFPEGLRGGEDAVFLFNCMINASGIIFINKVISHYDTNRTGDNQSLSHDKSLTTVTSRIRSYELMNELSIKYNKEDIFIPTLLNVKLHYWFINHLVPANTTTSDLVNIFKQCKNIYKQSIKYKKNTPNYLFEIYNDVIKNDFYNAVKTVNKKKKPSKFLISIIIPVFNAEQTLHNAFNSILKQSFGFENLEIIFIDDCSTDKSEEIIKSFSDKYENVKYYSSGKNSGYAGKPRNIGIDNATSDYLMFLDPDDIFLENACETLFRNIINDDLEMVSANYNINRNSKVERNNWNYIGLKDKDSKKVETIDDFHKFLMPPASVWAKIFKREFIVRENIKFLVGVPAQDLVFVSESLLKSKGIKFVNEAIVEYIPREKGDNKSTTATRDKSTLAGFLKSYKELLRLLYEHNPEYTWLATRNLHFWIKQFVLSELGINDKIDLLYDADVLFEDFIKSEKLNPSKGLEKFFELISEKEFLKAAKLSEELSFVYDKNEIIGDIKNRKILLISNICKDELKSYFDIAKELEKHDYETIILNLDCPETYDYDFQLFAKNYDDNLEFINIYDYYLEKNTENKNINISDENLIKTKEKNKNYNIKKFKTNDSTTILEYFNTTTNELIKTEIYLNNCLTIIKNYNNNQIRYEEFYTPDGHNYLSIIHNNNEKEVILHDKLMKFDIEFKNIYEFQDYFITEIVTKQKEKPFVIYYFNSDNYIPKETLNMTIELTDFNISFKELENNLEEEYIKEIAKNSIGDSENNISPNINKISKENDLLKKDNRKLYIENQKLRDKAVLLKNQITAEKNKNKNKLNKIIKKIRNH